MLLTAVFAEYLAVCDEFGDEVEWCRRRRRLVHVAKQLGSSELPLRVRLTFDLGVRIGHHGNEQVDEHDNRDDHEDAKDSLDERDRPPRVATQRRQVLRVDESEQREEQHLEDGNWRPGDDAAATVSITQVRHVGRRSADRQVDSGHLEREAEQEDDEDKQEQHEILHHLADDDRPRTEEMVEGQEIEELDEAEEHGECVELVARVHEDQAIFSVERQRKNVDEHSDCARSDYGHLQNTPVDEHSDCARSDYDHLQNTPVDEHSDCARSDYDHLQDTSVVSNTWN